MAKYLKLEKAANSIAQSLYASSQDKKEAWEKANKVWEQLKKLKGKK